MMVRAYNSIDTVLIPREQRLTLATSFLTLLA